MANQQDILDAIDQLLEIDQQTGKVIRKPKKRKVKLEKKYEYQKSMLYAIQALTNEPTHEIIANLVEEADKHMADSGIDLEADPKDNMLKDSWGHTNNERRIQKYMFYPGTELYLGIYVLLTKYNRSPGFDATLKYNFKLPTSALKMNQSEYDEYITDGILCDASKDVEKPEMRGTLNTEERKIAEEKRKEYARRKAAKYKNRPSRRIR